MKNSTLHALLIDELRDLYHMEHQLVKALPQVAQAAESPDLQSALTDHLEQTEDHVRRLEEAFEELDVAAKGKKCTGMEGVLEEGKEIIESDVEPPVLDAGIIAACQKVEHYEIAAYGAAHAHAVALGLPAVASLLEETLREEKAADAALNKLAQTINRQAADAVSQSPNGEKSRRSERPARSRSTS
jgi:ferritin-like metal-binding protein YciE